MQAVVENQQLNLFSHPKTSTTLPTISKGGQQPQSLQIDSGVTASTQKKFRDNLLFNRLAESINIEENGSPPSRCCSHMEHTRPSNVKSLIQKIEQRSKATEEALRAKTQLIKKKISLNDNYQKRLTIGAHPKSTQQLYDQLKQRRTTTYLEPLEHANHFSNPKGVKLRLENMIDDCDSLQKRIIQNLNKFEVDFQNQNIFNSQMDESLEMFDELDLVESNMLNKTYKYNKEDKDELKQTIKQVAFEHKSGWMDPSSANKFTG